MGTSSVIHGALSAQSATHAEGTSRLGSVQEHRANVVIQASYATEGRRWAFGQGTPPAFLYNRRRRRDSPCGRPRGAVHSLAPAAGSRLRHRETKPLIQRVAAMARLTPTSRRRNQRSVGGIGAPRFPKLHSKALSR